MMQKEVIVTKEKKSKNLPVLWLSYKKIEKLHISCSWGGGILIAKAMK